jgi:hypothetical protein
LPPVGAARDAPPDAPDADNWYRYPIIAFVVIGAALLVWVFVSAEFGFQHPNYHRPEPFRGAGLLEGWLRFDGNWYRNIVEEGYTYNTEIASTVAFFPAYPMAIRVVGFFVRDVALGAIIVSALAGFGASILYYRWCADRLSPLAARTSLLVLLLFPYAWYLFGAVYADSLFLLAVVSAFVLLERDRPVLAGLAGAVATGCRPVGLAVVLGLVLRTLERRGALQLGFLRRIGVRDRPASTEREPSYPRDDASELAVAVPLLALDLRALRPSDFGVLLSLAGLVGWSLYLWHRWGDPTLFVDVQRLPPWDQDPGPATWFKLDFFDSLRSYPDWAYNWAILFQAALAIGALLVVLAAARRFGWGYATYVIAVIGIPLIGSKDFQGIGRYLLAAFPLFAVAGELLVDRPRTKVAVLGASTVALLVWSSLYARGWYVA